MTQWRPTHHDHGAVAPYLEQYVRAVRLGDGRAAVDVTLEMLEHGFSAEDVIGRMLAPAQSTVGRGWQEGRWGVAMEHRATAITESALIQLMAVAARAPGVPPEGSGGTAAVACSEGEWHSLPARMMAEVLRLRGVDVAFVGPSMPARELDDYLGPEPPLAVALSCQLTLSLPGAWRSATVLRRLGVTVVAGGRGFGPHGRYASTVGADLWAPDFASGADLLVQALAQPRRPVRPATVEPDRAAELRDLERVADATVERAVAEAMAAWPTMMSRDAAVVATREDLRASVRIIAATMLVDDLDVIADYVRWFEDTLAPRGAAGRLRARVLRTAPAPVAGGAHPGTSDRPRGHRGLDVHPPATRLRVSPGHQRRRRGLRRRGVRVPAAAPPAGRARPAAAAGRRTSA